MKCPCCGEPRPSSPTRLALVLRAAVCLLVIVMAMGLELLGVGLVGRAIIVIPTVILLAWTMGLQAVWWTRRNGSS